MDANESTPSNANKLSGAAGAGSPSPDLKVDFSRGVEQFQGKTRTQVLQALIPSDKVEIFAGLMNGLGLDVGLPLPEWARKASAQFWRYFVGPKFDPDRSPGDSGVLIGLIERIAKHLPSETPNGQLDWIKIFLPGLLDAAHKGAQSLSPEEAADYYSGRAKSIKIAERLTDPEYLKMAKRAPIYFCIAVFWERFKSFSSQAEAERWLRSEKVIKENVESREVRAVFSVVGLRYRGPGRPRKTEPRRNPDSA